ncbi:hypothetical protein BOTBODRAFT_27528 [Botryobasidium botryosum FD-172 SS1]|uniref:Endonuclease/exonuclease/phosphatase domain-containing protein n=1 Tax=Botryobasidium botryosum (strain FD-172 SS1) TaxID=930990 RepID=A0A067MWI3_BOTB1|nr:hypothetical protein BOTBODRAFT_27528 [Botryobasidium botryosum FD-172 SS1]
MPAMPAAEVQEGEPAHSSDPDAALIRQNLLQYSPETESWDPYTLISPPCSTEIVAGSPALNLRLVTWNIDAFAPVFRDRINSLLSSIIDSKSDDEMPDIILLQEVNSGALNVLFDHSQVRSSYFVTDADPSDWMYGFQNITLLRKAFAVFVPGPVYRVPFRSHMGRRALVCDLHLCIPTSVASALRIINVHLDSLDLHPPFRPAQLALAAEHLRAQGVGCIAGDFNALSTEDATLSEDLGLVDAWKALNPETGDQEKLGHTWGVQKEEPYPPKRLDRVACLGLEVMGMGILPCGVIAVDVSDEDEDEDEVEEVLWSDHCGLWVEFRV